MTHSEILDLGNEQTIELLLESEDGLIGVNVFDGDETATVGLTIGEAEALIAKLAVKIAQLRMAG